MYKSANIYKRAEGCHPSTVERQASRRANGAALDPATEAANAPATRNAAPPAPLERHRQRRAAPATATDRTASPASPDRPRPRPMGDRTARAGVAGGTVIGGVARTRGAGSARDRERFAVGDVVWNASGRGVWGFGTIVGVIPAGVAPRWHCRRTGLPQLFRERSEASDRERYVVLGDDGRHHAPRRVEAAAKAMAARGVEGVADLVRQ